jgi:hypothetical protein
MSEQDKVVDFTCPECDRPCRFSEKQRALQHSNPVCKTWVAHKGRPQDFMGLALAAVRSISNGNLLLSDAGKQERSAGEERLRNDLIEQLHEGLKKL